MLLDDGRVMVTGGVPGGDDPGRRQLSASRDLQPRDEHLVPRGGPATPARSLTKPSNGKVLLTGGYSLAPSPPGEPGPTLADAELYDPATNTWSPAGSMSAPTAAHTATLLNNGRVIVAGGFAEAVQHTELYDPVTNTWSSVSPLLHPRYEFTGWGGFGPAHTATRLPNGAVLLAGGFDGTQLLADAELLDAPCAVNIGISLSHEPGLCAQPGAPFCQAFCANLGCGVKYDLPFCADLPPWGNPPVTQHSFSESCGCMPIPVAPPPPSGPCPPPTQTIGPERAGAICGAAASDPDAASFAADCAAHCASMGACAPHDQVACSTNAAAGSHRWTDLCVCTP
ncbi:MAG: kelch repeat-containing protein [Byssovorax sp.]